MAVGCLHWESPWCTFSIRLWFDGVLLWDNQGYEFGAQELVRKANNGGLDQLIGGHQEILDFCRVGGRILTFHMGVWWAGYWVIISISYCWAANTEIGEALGGQDG